MLTLQLKLAILALLTFDLPQIFGAKKWWETASFYQIYPRSFKDSDGDGIGDLKGITQQLDYLKEIGITATWLSPIFTSPMADFGYDISNFTEIDPMFGTMEDLEALLQYAKTIGVKIILDFVPNHSSDECEWFQKSIAGDKDYKDYYVWHPGKVVDGERKPPTNWISVFRGSMWTWNEQRQEYYLHQFHAKQPDLNYHNPKVRAAMKDVLRFWLRKGVAGFRVDAIQHTFEIAADSNGNWPDEPRNSLVNDAEDYDYLHHIYTVHQAETFDLVYEFRSVMDEMTAELGSDDLILMTESYGPIDVIMPYYGNGTHNGAQIPFNFELITNLKYNSDAYQYLMLINLWLRKMPMGATANWVLGNHDKSRVGTRLGKDRIDLINILLFTLPGCSVTYQGEEIGMTDVWISWKDTVDPMGCQSNPNVYEHLSRDPERTPFQWNDKKFAGFTEGAKTWLPVADDYELVNVKHQRGIPRSHLNVFKQLQALRMEPTLRNGNVEVIALSVNVLAVKRSLVGSPTFVILLNIMDNVEIIDLTAAFSGLPNELEYVLVTDKSMRRKNDKAQTNAIILLPKEAVILSTR